MKKLSFAIITFLGLGFQSTFAQTTATQSLSVVVPPVAMLAISGGVPSSMTFTQPSAAGGRITNPNAMSNSYLNYSSVVTTALANTGRKITAKIDAPIAGITIVLIVGTPNGTSSGGTLGFTSMAGIEGLTLTATAQDIIAGIGSCYTGIGDYEGSSLSYSVRAAEQGSSVSSYGDLRSGSKTVTVTYTMSE